MTCSFYLIISIYLGVEPEDNNQLGAELSDVTKINTLYSPHFLNNM